MLKSAMQCNINCLGKVQGNDMHKRLRRKVCRGKVDECGKCSSGRPSGAKDKLIGNGSGERRRREERDKGRS